MTNRRTKRFGQHMLMDEKVLDYEVAMLGPEGKVVLEIGGGTGNLSSRLAKKADKLIIVEKDPLMVERLVELFEYENDEDEPDKQWKKRITIIEGDFLEMTESQIKKEASVKSIDLIISNVPYVISSPLLFRLPQFKFDKAVLCFQKEFAQRMVTKPGDRDWSRLSVMTNIYFRPIWLRTVKRGSFKPVPRVDSAIVMVTKTGEKINVQRDKFIERLFSHRKNTLHAALQAEEMKTNYPDAIAAADALKLPGRRVFTLAIEELETLFAEL